MIECPVGKVFQGECCTRQRAVFINDEQLARRCTGNFSRTPLMFSLHIGVYLEVMTFFTLGQRRHQAGFAAAAILIPAPFQLPGEKEFPRTCWVMTDAITMLATRIRRD